MIGPLVVRADASASIGLGHLVRSLALANAWQDLAGPVVLATATSPEHFPASVPTDGIQVIPIRQPYPDPADPATVELVVAGNPGAWVVCDGYGFDAEYTRRLGGAGARVLVIDDQAHQPIYHADVLVNQNLAAESLAYHFDCEARVLLGPEFALLGRSYVQGRDLPRSIPDHAASLLVSLGGGRTPPVLGTVLRACARVSTRPLRIVVITGPYGGAALRREVDALVSSGVSVDLATNPADLPALMAAADLAVSSAGSTAWQLCCLGVPAAVLTLVDNQAGIGRSLDEAGCAVSLGWHADVDEDRLGAALDRLLGDRALRVGMSERGRALVDGRGAERVAATLLEIGSAQETPRP